MNENRLEKIENKKFLSLKEENEDNLIENRSKTNKILEKLEEKDINESPKYKISYTGVLSYINKKDKSKVDDQKEFITYLLLLPSNINIKDKASVLCSLSNFYQKTGQKELLIRIATKFEKMIKENNNLEAKYFMNCFYHTSYILWENYQNFFYALKFINKCFVIVNMMKDKYEDNNLILIKDKKDLISQATASYLADKKKNFTNETSNEMTKKIDELINFIITEQNNKDVDENDENKKYLYAISRDWIVNLLTFIKQFITDSTDDKNKSTNLIQNYFEFNYVCESYVKENKNEKGKTNDHLFPGPIDNFKITSFKDSWKDKDNIDENDYIKKKAEYYLVNYEDWNFLATNFGYTNIIRRKKDNLDLVSFKFVLFDKRIRPSKQNLKLLKERYVQIKKNLKIKQVKDKILRCADNELNANEKEKEIFFYILDRDKGEILIEIIFGFANSIPMYESLYIKKIELQDEENLDNLFSVFDKKKHFLLVEIIQKGEINFLVQIDKNNNKCTICGKEIKDIKNIYKCQVCHFSLFCSRNCAGNSDSHRELDRQLKQLMEEKFNLADILSEKYNYLLKKGNQGKANIEINSEDETFFISSIHCLSHTLGLTKYFMTLLYKQEQKPGIDLYFTDFYYKLINSLWDLGSRNITINSQHFCDRIGLKFNSNIEPSDFIFHLFEKLNEELNRAPGDTNKEIEEKKEEESEEQACKRFNIFHKKKKDSIIRDLFVGQCKDKTKCITCGSEFIKFLDFLILSLPLPDKKMNIQIKLFTKSLDYYYVNFKINENTEMKDILFKSIQYLKKKSYIKYFAFSKTDEGIYNHNITDIPEGILYNHLQFIEINKDFKIINMYNTSYNNIKECKNNKNSFDTLKYKDYKENLDKKSVSELVIYEIGTYSNKPNYISVFVYPIASVEKDTMFYVSKKYYKILTYPVVISINKNESLEALKTAIFNKFKKAIMIQFQNESNSIDIFFPHFGNSWENLKMPDGKCPICQKVYSKSIFCCSLFETIDKSTTIESLLEKQPKGRPLILYAKSDIYEQKKFIYKGMELSFEKGNEIDTKEIVSIYDSLDYFNKENMITDEKWICKKCGKPKMFKRIINLYKLPNYLIIKLKKGKNEKSFEYKEILDLKEYILNPEKEETLYDLYAVILYKKSLNYSGYSCFCKNFGTWISFSLEGMEYTYNPISKDAYMLFYKKRNVE